MGKHTRCSHSSPPTFHPLAYHNNWWQWLRHVYTYPSIRRRQTERQPILTRHLPHRTSFPITARPNCIHYILVDAAVLYMYGVTPTHPARTAIFPVQRASAARIARFRNLMSGNFAMVAKSTSTAEHHLSSRPTVYMHQRSICIVRKLFRVWRFLPHTQRASKG